VIHTFWLYPIETLTTFSLVFRYCTRPVRRNDNWTINDLGERVVHDVTSSTVFVNGLHCACASMHCNDVTNHVNNLGAGKKRHRRNIPGYGISREDDWQNMNLLAGESHDEEEEFDHFGGKQVNPPGHHRTIPAPDLFYAPSSSNALCLECSMRNRCRLLMSDNSSTFNNYKCPMGDLYMKKSINDSVICSSNIDICFKCKAEPMTSPDRKQRFEFRTGSLTTMTTDPRVSSQSLCAESRYSLKYDGVRHRLNSISAPDLSES